MEEGEDELGVERCWVVDFFPSCLLPLASCRLLPAAAAAAASCLLLLFLDRLVLVLLLLLLLLLPFPFFFLFLVVWTICKSERTMEDDDTLIVLLRLIIKIKINNYFFFL